MADLRKTCPTCKGEGKVRLSIGDSWAALFAALGKLVLRIKTGVAWSAAVTLVLAIPPASVAAAVGLTRFGIYLSNTDACNYGARDSVGILAFLGGIAGVMGAVFVASTFWDKWRRG